MAKKEFKSEVIERIDTLKENNGYTKEVLRMIWGDNPITIDIRMVNKSNDFIGKGVSLSDAECEKLVDILLDRGYGSIEKIKEVLVKRMRRTNPDIKDYDDVIDCVYEDDDGKTYLEIPKYN